MTAKRINPELPRPASRELRNDADVARIRELLLETYPIIPVDWNWEVRRWDGWRYHRGGAAWNPIWEETVRVWETEDGRLVGAVFSESGGDAHLQIHPDYRHFVEPEMFAWAEEHLARYSDDGNGRQLQTFVLDYDVPRQRLLAARGYEKTVHGEVSRRMRLGNAPLAIPDISDGYIMRTTQPNSIDDCQAVVNVLNAAFDTTVHSAQGLYEFVTHSPSFRHDLDLVAEAPDGSIAAYVGMVYDERNRRGIFEPVCTHPDHQRRGLARALMIEGFWRLRALGAKAVYVGTGDEMAANALYDAVGFSEAYRGNIWRKSLS